MSSVQRHAERLQADLLALNDSHDYGSDDWRRARRAVAALHLLDAGGLDPDELQADEAHVVEHLALMFDAGGVAGIARLLELARERGRDEIRRDEIL